MDLSAVEPRVRFELRGRAKRQLRLVHDWLCSAEEIGLPERLNRSESLYQGYNFHFPDRVLDGLKAVLADSEYNDLPLWLHLAKPLGYLNLVPWEQLLGPELGMPLLRLPDFLAKPPRESLNSLDVILCTSLPVAKESFMAIEHLGRMAEHISAIGPPNTTIHVFTDQEIHKEVARGFATLPKVRVYDPTEARSLPTVAATKRVLDRPGRIDNPWLVWMRNALQGRSVDVAHFLAHGYLSRDQGALAFAESPMQNVDSRIARFVGATELLTFLTQIGAWVAAFSSPEHNYSEMGLRLLADSIAQMRPGPVLHHELRLDRDCASMADAYRFLFGRGSAKPPSSPAQFIYCHPSRLEPQPPIAVPVFKGIKTTDTVTRLYEGDKNVPAWIAATERYVEQRRLEAERMYREDELATTTNRSREKREKDAASIQDTLQQIEETLARVAAQTEAGDDHG
jgi:hypothetical protein